MNRILKLHVGAAFFLCCFVLGATAQAATKIRTFDLFGFQAEWLTKSRIVAAKQVEESLRKRGISLENKAGRVALILDVEGSKSLVELGSSETEGFWFTLSDLPGDIKRAQAEAKGQPSLLSEKKLGKKEFEPLSNAFPALQLGATSPEALIAFLGKADYTGADPNDESKEGLQQSIWILKRDYKKEKDCYDAVAKKPPFQAQQVIFTFDAQRKLRKIAFVNWISGEC